ncbi:MAG: TraR/DksA C4-type zinc finger protein [Gemmataceae bacterium]
MTKPKKITKKKMQAYAEQLRDMARRMKLTASALEDEARSATSGEAGGNLSNAPMHIGDVGSAAYEQELSATLLENEEYLLEEIQSALDRIDAGTFGVCEGCGATLREARLEILPYTRYCVTCAEMMQAGLPVNLNEGRPHLGSETANPHDDAQETAGFRREGDRPTFTGLESRNAAGDIHAAGEPGGGSAIGGLAGTTVGEGDPADANLRDAMGSGAFDVTLGQGAEDGEEGYGGPSGGAVGGTPAGKRARGGQKG